MYRVVSWGCGVQSTTLAVMSALGDLPRVDCVIHADTGFERRGTEEARDFYREWLGLQGVAVEIVSNGSVRDIGGNPHAHIPFWTVTGGPLRRQCTGRFKILPVKRRVRELMGFDRSKPPHPKPESVEQWIGFSLDEWTRIKASRVRFISPRWPLVEKYMTRDDCVDYLEAHGLPVPVKSACVCCPYRRASGWLDMRENSPGEFAEAVEFDEAHRLIPALQREGVEADKLYIYKHGGPLAQARLEADAARERKRKALQLPLLCESGYCWT